MKPVFLPSVEPLESRIAPASISFTDVDGDMITITSLLGTEAQLDAAVLRTASGSGFEISKIVLKDAVFQGTDLTIASEGAGDGLVDVPYINATDRDLNDVTVDGNLGRIRGGDLDTATPAIHFLTVESFGATGGVNSTVDASRFDGAVEKIEIHGDLKRAAINVRADVDADGSIASIIVAGSLVGGADVRAGAITASGEMTSIEIGGDLVGGAGFESGSIGGFGKLGTIVVHGSITGGLGFRSGSIASKGGIDSVTVDETLKGGAGEESGSIGSLGRIELATVGIRVVGGGGMLSGVIASEASLGTIKVGAFTTGGGELRGGSGKLSGAIGSQGDVDSVTIEGPITGGSGARSGMISSFDDIGSVQVIGALAGAGGSSSGSIFARGDISNATVGTNGNGDSMIGGSGAFSGAITSLGSIGDVNLDGAIRAGTAPTLSFAASISARGVLSDVSVGAIIGKPASRITIAALGDFDDSDFIRGISATLGSLSVSGSVEFANILAGQTTRPVAGEPNQILDVSIGSVSISGSIRASTILAGVITDAGAVFNGFSAPNLSKTLVAKGGRADNSFINSVSISGDATGTVAIIAENVSNLVISDTSANLNSGSNNDRTTLAPDFPKVFVNEGFTTDTPQL